MKKALDIGNNVLEAASLAERAKILKQTKKLSKKERRKAAFIIHTASVATAAVGGGLAQLPGSDAAVIVPIQVTMVISLGKLFSHSLKDGVAKSIVLETTATMIGRGISEFLVGWVPVAGNVLNATTAVAITELLGWIVANEFAEN
ncbi:MAG: hypothetical protein LBM95_03325 [Lactobacillales bacterium]|nr:hypothetical protein [Lactobacillales bacterium]